MRDLSHSILKKIYSLTHNGFQLGLQPKFALASWDQVHKQGQATGPLLLVPWQVPADCSHLCCSAHRTLCWPAQHLGTASSPIWTAPSTSGTWTWHNPVRPKPGDSASTTLRGRLRSDLSHSLSSVSYTLYLYSCNLLPSSISIPVNYCHSRRGFGISEKGPSY